MLTAKIFAIILMIVAFGCMAVGYKAILRKDGWPIAARCMLAAIILALGMVIVVISKPR